MFGDPALVSARDAKANTPGTRLKREMKRKRGVCGEERHKEESKKRE